MSKMEATKSANLPGSSTDFMISNKSGTICLPKETALSNKSFIE